MWWMTWLRTLTCSYLVAARRLRLLQPVLRQALRLRPGSQRHTGGANRAFSTHRRALRLSEARVAHTLLPVTHTLLPVTYTLLPVTHTPLPVTYTLLPVTHTLLPVAHTHTDTAAGYTHTAAGQMTRRVPRSTHVVNDGRTSTPPPAGSWRAARTGRWSS